ncbi:Yip1 family protein [Streptomyces triculaminicus]|uniref:Yip1 family protein n=1 Tax=Streptomyces triculaminicus TaxID=2816232 RepID=UPI0037CE85EA
MSQVGRNAGLVAPGPAPGRSGTGYVQSVAGFRMGRGRDSHDPGPARQGQQAPYGGQGAPGQPGIPGYGGGQQQWQQQPGGYDEPEYFGNGGHQAPPQSGYGQQYGGPAAHDPYYGRTPDDPGRTQQFSLGEAPDAYGGYGGDAPYGDAGVPAPPPGPRLHWKDLLSGIVLRPQGTFWQMRDHAMWGPALIVTFVYGLLAVFGFDKAREDVLNASLANSLPAVLITGVVVVIAGLILGAVTHTLARQLGGDGLWQPTVGLSMLIMSISDAPRLLFAMFLGGDSTLVQVLGWATWVAGGALLTSMVAKSHDLPWPRALGASAIQLVALLSLMKLGTL